VVALEQNHSPAQVEAEEQQRLELQQEVGRLRSAQVQTERAHRQRVRGLEEQVHRPPPGKVVLEWKCGVMASWCEDAITCK
jgi:hypothetical protein